MRIGSVVLFYEQFCLQSYSWQAKRPLGDLQRVLDSLEEYQCDEIALIRPVRSYNGTDEYQSDIAHLKSIKSMTPISLGGGIRSIEDLMCLKGVPVERLIFSSSFLDKNQQLIDMATQLFGKQAIQCLLPAVKTNNGVFVYHSGQEKLIRISDLDREFIEQRANEVIIVDTVHEGLNDKFDWTLVDELSFAAEKLVISGGVGHQTVKEAKSRKIASVLIDNKVLHKETSITGYKNAATMS